jgi:aspartate kinase
LVHLAKQITPAPNSRELDMLLTTGEQVSIALLTMALQEKGVKARSLTGWQAGVLTDEVHGKALVKEVQTETIRSLLHEYEVIVVAGFQGVSPSGEITTLGRGGSDTSAVVLAAALEAEFCEIYTDVTGVFTADPRFIPGARKLEEISYEEMLELAHLGAGVLHPRAVETALIYRVNLVVRSSFIDEPGTWVKGDGLMEKEMYVRGIAHDLDVVRISVLGLPNQVGTMSRLFGFLAQDNINVDIIIQSEHGDEKVDVSFSVSEDEGKKALHVIQEAANQLCYTDLLYESGLAKVSAVGVGMMTKPGVAAIFFSTLSEAGIPIKMVSTSEIKISCVVDREQVLEAARRLHQAFELEQPVEGING